MSTVLPTLESPTQSAIMQPAYQVAGLIALVMLVYWPVYQFGFVNFDDPAYVSQNQYVQAGFTRDSLHLAFTASFGGWSPLLWISYLLDRQIFGAAARGLHIENVLWHLAGAVLLWQWLVKRTSAPGRSWVVAALFLCHPMHVESVAWISERKDVLSTVLLFLAIHFYCAFTTSRRPSAYVLMLLTYLSSLMTKATGVTLPALLLLIDVWPLRRVKLDDFKRPMLIRLLVEKIPVALVAVVFSMIAFLAQNHSNATQAAAGLPIMDRLGNAIVCYVIYIVKLAIPTGLAAFYPHPGARPLFTVFISMGLLALITWLTVRTRVKLPYLIVGWLWFLVTLIPMIGLVQLSGQAMADRYSYLSSIGLFIAVVWGMGDLLRRAGLSYSNRAGRWILLTVSSATLIAFCVIAHQQVWYWKDSRTLFQHSLDVTGANPVACFVLGVDAQQRGDRPAAVDYLMQVIEQDPGNDKAFKLLGDLWSEANLQKAIICYQRCVTLKPERIDYRITLAMTLTRIGDLASLQAAQEQLQHVLEIHPDHPQALAGLADLQSRIASIEQEH